MRDVQSGSGRSYMFGETGESGTCCHCIVSEVIRIFGADSSKSNLSNKRKRDCTKIVRGERAGAELVEGCAFFSFC